jgi:hypothetical protein
MVEAKDREISKILEDTAALRLAAKPAPAATVISNSDSSQPLVVRPPAPNSRT